MSRAEQIRIHSCNLAGANPFNLLITITIGFSAVVGFCLCMFFPRITNSK